MPELGYVHDRLLKLFSEKLYLTVPSVDTDLLDSGMLDSLSFVTLLVELEEEFGTKISPEDVEIDQFSSIAKIAEFVDLHDRP
jgi:methoxymalonate biosynthesis acyl carrier protein